MPKRTGRKTGSQNTSQALKGRRENPLATSDQWERGALPQAPQLRHREAELAALLRDGARGGRPGVPGGFSIRRYGEMWEAKCPGTGACSQWPLPASRENATSWNTGRAESIQPSPRLRGTGGCGGCGEHCLLHLCSNEAGQPGIRQNGVGSFAFGSGSGPGQSDVH